MGLCVVRDTCILGARVVRFFLRLVLGSPSARVAQFYALPRPRALGRFPGPLVSPSASSGLHRPRALHQSPVSPVSPSASFEFHRYSFLLFVGQVPLILSLEVILLVCSNGVFSSLVHCNIVLRSCYYLGITVPQLSRLIIFVRCLALFSPFIIKLQRTTPGKQTELRLTSPTYC